VTAPKKRRHYLPTYRKMLTRPKWQNGSDVGKVPDSWLAAKLADQIIMREIVARTIVADDIPICWPAAFRGALARLTAETWRLNCERILS
jgi:hypothetical protein